MILLAFEKFQGKQMERERERERERDLAENRGSSEASAFHGGSERFFIGRRVISCTYVHCYKESRAFILCFASHWIWLS